MKWYRKISTELTAKAVTMHAIAASRFCSVRVWREQASSEKKAQHADNNLRSLLAVRLATTRMPSCLTRIWLKIKGATKCEPCEHGQR